MPSLRASLETLTATFTQGLLDAFRGVSLEEILAEVRPSGGARRGPPPLGRVADEGAKVGRKRGRPPAADARRVAADALAFLGRSPKGVRSEELREQLGVARAVLQRVLRGLLAAGQVRKTGEKRATTYFVGGSRAAATASKATKPAGRVKMARKRARKVTAKTAKASGRPAPAAPKAETPKTAKPKKRKGALVVYGDGAKAEGAGKVV